MNTFNHAKKVMDFYMSKLAESDTEEAQFAMQYAMLKSLRFRTSAVLDSLHNYDIEAE